MKRTRVLGALGLGLTLTLAGTVPAMAAPASDCAAAPDAIGTVFTVSASGDSGPGTFAQAVLDANATPGTDTIRLAPGLEITETVSHELTGSVLIDGSCSSVTWAPATPGTDSWLRSDAQATVSVVNLDVEQTAENWEPLISLMGGAPGETTELRNVTLRNSWEGLLSLDEAKGDVTIAELDVDGSRGEAEVAAIWVSHLEGSLTITDSVFQNLDMTAVAIDGGELTAAQSISSLRNTFRDIHVSEAETPGLGLGVGYLDSADGAPRTDPMVTVSGNTFASISGSASGALALESIEGDVVIESTSVSDVSDAEGYLTGAAYASQVVGSVTVTDSRFLDNRASGLRLENLELAATDQVLVRTSEFSRNGSIDGEYGGGLFLEASSSESRDTPMIDISDSTFLENSGGPGRGISVEYDVDGELAGPGAVMTGNTLSNGDLPAVQPEVDSEHALLAVDGWLSGASALTMHLRNNTVEMGAERELGVPGVAVSQDGADSLVEHLTMPGAPFEVVGEGTGAEVRFSALGDSTNGGVITLNDERVTGSENTVPVSGKLVASGADVLPLADWDLGELAVNGGATQTMLPGGASPLIDAAPGSAVPADQRGVARPQGSAPDRGAVEVATGELNVGPDVTVSAGDTASLTIERTGNSALAATAVVELADGTAVAGTDYESERYELSWAAGDAEPKTIAVQTLVAGVGTRDLTATIAEATGAGIGPRPVGTITIVRDAAPGLGTVSMGPDVSVAAGDPATLTVTRAGDPAGAATARVELRDGTAVAGTDYVAERFELSWAAGDAEPKTVTVRTLAQEPGSRQLTATVTAVSGATPGDRVSATVTVQRDEPGTPTVPPTDTPSPGPAKLSETGSDGGYALAGLAAAMLALGGGLLALRTRVRRQG